MKINALLTISEPAPTDIDLSMILLAVFGVFAAWELLQGLRRGVFRQIAHAVCTAIAGLVSFFVTKNLTQTFLNEFNEQTMPELIAQLEASGFAESMGISSETLSQILGSLSNAEYLLALPIGVFVTPFVFVILFAALLLVSKVIYFIIRLIARLPKAKGMGSRLGGMLIGAAEGLLVCAIFFVPFVSMFSLVDEGVELIREKNDPAYVELIAEYDESFSPLINHFTVKAVDTIGAGAIADAFATVEIDGTKINLRDELVSGVAISMELSAISGADLANLTDGDKAIIASAVDSLGASDYLATVVSGVLNSAAHLVESGLIPLEAEPPMDALIDDLLALLETSNKDNLKGDMTTILNVCYTLAESGMFSTEGGTESDPLAALTARDENGDTLIGLLIDELSANDRTKPIVATLSRISLSVIADNVGLDEFTVEKYEDFKDDFVSVVSIDPDSYATEDEYKAALKSSIDEAFAENGLGSIPEDLNDSIASFLDEEIIGKDSYTVNDVEDIVFSYYDEFLEFLESREPAEE